MVEAVGLAVVVLGTLLALVVVAFAILSTLTAPKLRDEAVDLPEGVPWPRVSLIVPACNESSTIEAAARTLLNIDYPDLEIILINDRSEDGTGAIVDALSKEDDRVCALHIQDLPEGWLGKLNALHVGTQRASGDLLLFTDADVHFEPESLRRAVTWMEREQLGHLTLLPRMIGSGFVMNAATSAFAVGYLAAVKAWWVGKPDTRAYAGVGAFGLVRRADFERTPGWEWLRLELGDDIGLGMMMVRQAGVLSQFGMAADDLSIRWYESLWGLVRGLEKNSYGAMLGFRLGRLVRESTVILTMTVSPLVALVSGIPWVQALGGLVMLAMGVLALVFRRAFYQPVIATFLSPLTTPVLITALVRSAWATHRNGGVRWRGTFYGLSALREGRRVDL